MFACLSVIRQEPEGILKRVFRKLTKPKAELASIQAFGAEYLSLTVRIPADGGVDWDEAARLLPYKICLLAPEGFSPPEGYGFRKAFFPEFERQILLRTACALVEKTAVPVYRRVLGLLDSDGSFARLLSPLLRVYSSVRVVTQNPALYRSAAERMMEELGAPVIISGGPSDFGDCALLLCPGTALETRALPPRCPVLAGNGFTSGKAMNVFSEPSPRQDAAVIRELPPGVDFRKFAGAMYEYHGIELGPLHAARLLLNGLPVRLDEARNFLEHEAGY